MFQQQLYLWERFGDVGIHLPVHSPPHFETVVIGLGGDVLPYWIPGQAFNQPSVSSQACDHLWRDMMEAEAWREGHSALSLLWQYKKLKV